MRLIRCFSFGKVSNSRVITRFVEGKDWIHRKKLAQKAA